MSVYTQQSCYNEKKWVEYKKWIISEFKLIVNELKYVEYVIILFELAYNM